MSQKSEALASQFEQALAELVRTIESASDAQWRAQCGEEGWTVAATAHHVGAQWPLEQEYLFAAAEGKPVPTYTWDEINAKNEAHAEKFASCSKADALAVLREKGPGVAAWVRGLTDEQLASTIALPLANGAQVSTEQLILGGVLIDHAVAHTKSIKAVG